MLISQYIIYEQEEHYKCVLLRKILYQEDVHMGEKDISSKSFEALPDVFADIMNTYLFYDNKDFRIEPEMLEDLPTESVYYDGDDILRNQYRDIFKSYGKAVLHIANFGIENETTVDRMMAIRDMGYAYGNYRKQVDEYKNKRKLLTDRLKEVVTESEKADVSEKIKALGRFELIPVITLVLNFSGKSWDEPKDLRGLVNDDNPLRDFVPDYMLRVIDIHETTRDELSRMSSDFRHLVSVLTADEEKSPGIEEFKGSIDHPIELLDMLAAYGR